MHSILERYPTVDYFPRNNVPKADSAVTVDYTLKDPEGNVLDSGTDKEFNLAGGVISAWPKIIPLINKGVRSAFSR